MNIKERIFLIASIVTCLLLQTDGADKYTDGNRPYEFGFSIDGEQHRHEKKDEKGLIEGEFGFITADGVYHVTVYATDEQGRFKILSMKNIRVKPYPTYTAKQSNTSARQGHSLDLPAEQPAVSSSVSTTTFKPISIQPPANSCSHCSIPTTPTPAPPVPAFNQPPNNSNPNQIATAPNPRFPQGIKPQSTFVNQENGANLPSPLSPQPGFGGAPTLSGVTNYPSQSQSNLPQTPLSQSLTPPQSFNNIPQQNIPQQGFGASQSSLPGINNVQENQPRPGSSNFPQVPITPTFSQALPQSPDNYQNVLQTSNPVSENAVNSPNPSRGTFSNDRTAKKLDLEPQTGLIGSQPNSLQRGVSNSNETPTKPTLISAQMQIVDKNTDIYRRGPGEYDGLPEGLTKNDMSRLLYTFNYTVGFHGHFEEGYTDGVKQGYYFITGRNGVRTRVDYIADSTGFHPKISQEVLDLLSDDVPKPETEKEEKFGLKGYEFKWLYYPVEAKGR